MSEFEKTLSDKYNTSSDLLFKNADSEVEGLRVNARSTKNNSEDNQGTPTGKEGLGGEGEGEGDGEGDEEGRFSE